MSGKGGVGRDGGFVGVDGFRKLMANSVRDKDVLRVAAVGYDCCIV